MGLEQGNGRIRIELVYAGVEAIHCVSLQLNQGATIRDAIQGSGILEKYPEIELGKNKVGIFSKLQELDTVLHDHDRVEIYRPLLVDPKESRRRRAALKEKLDKK